MLQPIQKLIKSTERQLELTKQIQSQIKQLQKQVSQVQKGIITKKKIKNKQGKAPTANRSTPVISGEQQVNTNVGIVFSIR